MIDNRTVVAIIPARGGSKGVPRKNLRKLGGVPLVAWPIEVARMCTLIDRIIVSTDSEEIAETSRQHGAEVMIRPAELSTDTATIANLLRHLAVELRESDKGAPIVLLLEPTSPFRRAEDIESCLNLMVQRRYDSVATFTEASLNPNRAWRIEDSAPSTFIDGAIPWLPRQSLPPAFELNGAVYALDIDKLGREDVGILVGRSGAVMMERRRSLDINDNLDFLVADALIASGECPDLKTLAEGHASSTERRR